MVNAPQIVRLRAIVGTLLHINGEHLSQKKKNLNGWHLCGFQPTQGVTDKERAPWLSWGILHIYNGHVKLFVLLELFKVDHIRSPTKGESQN